LVDSSWCICKVELFHLSLSSSLEVNHCDIDKLLTVVSNS